MMAPTEILAEQHFRTLKAALRRERQRRRRRRTRASRRVPRPADCRIALLTGSLKAKEKRELYEAIEAGEIDIICGTHALIQGGVRFHDLGVAVVDEQHRFGVMQRAALREKGAQAAHTPHMLVMTATPIPRTLALTLYGDLDISVVDELPPGPPADQDDVGRPRRARRRRALRARAGRAGAAGVRHLPARRGVGDARREVGDGGVRAAARGRCTRTCASSCCTAACRRSRRTK